MFSNFPGEVLLAINDRLASGKDTKSAACVNKHWCCTFQPEIGKVEAKEATEYAIHPTKENVEKLKVLLKNCPALLLHPMKVKNRHGQVMEGTVYQIALHECDDELINDVIKPAFERLPDGLEKMEAQRKAQLPEGWLEAEEKACASVFGAIDNLYTVLKSASKLNDLTESLPYPFMITINYQDVKEAIEAYRKAIDALYVPTNEVIESGRDPSIRLCERILDRFTGNYNALGGNNTPRNNVVLRQCFGYAQRFSPINLLQAHAQGPYYIVVEKEKLSRTFEYGNLKEHFILPLDSEPVFRLGYEYYVFGGARVARRSLGGGEMLHLQNFFQSKTAAALQPCVMRSWKSSEV